MMMVLSDEDKVIDWRAAQAFFEAADSPQKQLILADDTGHAIPLDHGWRELTLNIAAWLKGRLHDDQH